ncbi:hypothetical protein QQF64_002773 [Cirrhinus molitorella]|uniref:Uncharacterized protein n=1 Tax=Cirrhinus molitorella TaxID=172907 RepID=A0ABR3MR52_9TELE
MQTVFRCFRQQDGVKEPLRAEHTHVRTHPRARAPSLPETRAEESQSVSFQHQSRIMDLRGSHTIGMILPLYLIFYFITGSIEDALEMRARWWPDIAYAQVLRRIMVQR